MTQLDRRSFLLASAASVGLPAALAKAWAIDADVRTGTIRDVEHVVILMQENRSFDHYFGTMPGVRGFGDRFPIPLSGGRTVWTQKNGTRQPPLIAPFALNTVQTFAHMRVENTPHSWSDAQYAWDGGRMGDWPKHKLAHSMGHYEAADIPFQWAMANAFTVCDAYHCSTQTGTNTNRLFLWSGTNDGLGQAGGPSISNSHDNLPPKGAMPNYTWTTYPERLEAAGVSWRVYQDMADNFTDNPLAGFKVFRESYAKAPGSDPRWAEKGLSTRHLDGLREDVLAGRLPQVSWIVSPAADSEHPDPSSPAQGADYTARVLDCLTANPQVWARTVFLVMFDENDGFFDHMPPPSPPLRDADGRVHGVSTVDTAAEYHLVRAPSERTAEREDLMGRPYGLGPRVPMYVISPWSRGGWVNAQVFDHSSVIRFCEARFGVMEPNISAWRRAVCGDLTSCFDFATPNAAIVPMPPTLDAARRAAALPGRTTPPTPDSVAAPVQATGVRPSRPLPYALDAEAAVIDGDLVATFRNLGKAGAVFHVYDRLRLEDGPRRYTVEAGKTAQGRWPGGAYDLFIVGPNGFHRHFAGSPAAFGGGPQPLVRTTIVGSKLHLRLVNAGARKRALVVRSDLYPGKLKPWIFTLAAAKEATRAWDLSGLRGWYDLDVRIEGVADWRRRLAGRIETGAPSTSDPSMGGVAIMTWNA
jgi:phospholipase C